SFSFNAWTSGIPACSDESFTNKRTNPVNVTSSASDNGDPASSSNWLLVNSALSKTCWAERRMPTELDWDKYEMICPNSWEDKPRSLIKSGFSPLREVFRLFDIFPIN